MPDSFDWSNPNKNYKNRKCTTTIKDQGNCGSCWAFGTVGPLESAILIKEAVPEDLSEQWLVSCNTNGYGCDGGWWAHKWHAGTQGKCGGTGAVYEDEFEYTSGSSGTEPSCDGPYPHVYLLKDWAFVGSSGGVPSTESIKNAIYNYGPVSAAVYVNSEFQYYTGGIFDTTDDGRINHAIVLVGWNEDPGYWILRNSWGDDWGENGYMRIAYGCQSVGYAACYVNGYEKISSGDQTVTVYIDEITNSGDQYEPIDPIGARAPEWYYKIDIGPEYSELNENLEDGTYGFWPWDWKHEHTWDVNIGHKAYVEDSEIDIKIEVWDNDLGETDDQADITPKSGRTFNGIYNLITNELTYSDESDVPTSGGVYSIVGTSDDNAKLEFTVDDSYVAENYEPELEVSPSSLGFGSKQQGTYTKTLTIKNEADIDHSGWADQLSWTASDNKNWISLSKTSGSLDGGQADSITVTVNANDLARGETHSGTISISSNGGSKTVSVSISISTAKPKNTFITLRQILEQFPFFSSIFK